MGSMTSIVDSPTLCLNMIVKNESAIIERLLKSVAPWIDSYCICDTGSTDNTIEIIERFFAQAGIPGVVVQEPFKNFGYNRSFAVKQCESITQFADYILLMDADMILQVGETMNRALFREYLSKADVHNIFQGTEIFLYKNVRIVRNRANMSYIGVTHEYVNVPNGLRMNHMEKSVVFILDIGDGGSKQDKFLRDIRLLTQGLIDEPENKVRYTFYLANSYRDSGQIDLAIETYKERAGLGGWIEEVWQSYYNIGNCYYKKRDFGNAIFYWLEAYQCYPVRIENLFSIIQHYRMQEKYCLAYPFYRLAKHQLLELKKKGGTPDYLFTQKDIYDYKMDYEMTILGYYCNTDGYDLQTICMDVLIYPTLDESILRNILSNYKFYTRGLVKEASVKEVSVKEASVNNGSRGIIDHIHSATLVDRLSMDIDDSFVSSTPSIVFLSKNRLAICNRYVNYRIDDKGGYVNQGTIETRNVLTIITLSGDSYTLDHQSIIQHNKEFDDRYIGIEDIRLFSQDGETLEYYGNRGMPDGSMQVEMGTIDISTATTIDVIHPHIDNQSRIEKNWVSFSDPQTKERRTIYGWSPLTIGTIVQDTSQEGGGKFSKTHEISCPRFFRHVRGSTHGQTIGDEIWFLCHLVSYESRRYYYHLMVVLDASTYQLRGYSPLFTFEKQAVEYTLGFTYLEESNTMFIGYSLMDRETKYMEIAKSWFDDSMITV